MPFNVTPELVAVNYLKTIDGVPDSLVATTLPKDFFDNASIASSGFVQVTNVGSSTDPYTPTRSSLVQVDVWFYAANSGKPPWNKAAVLAEKIVRGTESYNNVSITTPANYEDARVHSAIVQLEPRRMQDVEERVARYSLDLVINWTRVEA